MSAWLLAVLAFALLMITMAARLSPMPQRPALDYPDHPLFHFVQEAADEEPDRLVLRFEEETLTYGQLDRCGNTVANALLGCLPDAISVGDRVLLLASNRTEWLIAQHGIGVAGAAAVLANSSWKAAELAHAMKLTDPVAVIAEARFTGLVEEALQLVVEETELADEGQAVPESRIRLGLSMDRLTDRATDLAAETSKNQAIRWTSFDEVYENFSSKRPTLMAMDLDEAEALLPFSSGTTGLSKAVRHTHRSTVTGTIQRLDSYDIGREDRLQYFMALFTIYGVIVLNSVYAARATLRLYKRFEPVTALANMAEERITIGFGASPVAVALNNRDDLEAYDLSSMRYMLWGATPILPETADRFTERTGVPWLGAYATTEVGITSNPATNLEMSRIDTPGYALADVDIRIIDPETLEDVDPKTSGEIVVRSPSVMKGYLPVEDNAGVFLEGGWFRTGDIGWMEPDGWLHITDRLKEMIKVSGFAVAPAEIEKELFTHPNVADCAVYGVPHPEKGEVPKAAIVVKPVVVKPVVAKALLTENSDGVIDQAALAAELKAFVAEKLPTFKHLHEVEFIDEIPRNAGGKVLRRILRGEIRTS